MIDRLRENRRIDLFQLALTVLVSPFLVFAIVQSVRNDHLSWEALFLTLTLAAFLGRVRYPEIALLAQAFLAFCLANFPSTSSDEIGRAILAACLMSVALMRERVIVVISSVIAVLTTFGIAWHYGLDGDGSSTGLTDYGGLIAQAAAAVGIGTAIRIQRQYIAEIRDRADRERQNREIEFRQGITGERLRIARELHDSVAHHITVVNMFLGLARTTARTSPEKTEETLASAQVATRSVLAELQHILQLLREPNSGDAGGGVDPPVPDEADIEALVAGFRDAGMSVSLEQVGVAHAVSIQTGLTMYRLIQEALTNANKYGTGPVEVRMTYAAEQITIEVNNAIAATQSGGVHSGAGLGLIGMGERVRFLRGSLQYGADDGRFRLIAKLPIERAHGSQQP
jgi:signal transduction histidine kinase